jgi:2-polyprenyl-6-methoxyphenol hydroxylase-like FAD-dependent oxidoreductase
MTTNHYDVIVVGARCAGSPTAMLLARQGYRVLLVDRATFPSDTISTHVIHPTGIAALNRWGLLDHLLSTGCPPVGTYAFDFGPFTIAGSPGTDDSPVAYAPRLPEHRVINSVLGREVRVQRGWLHADPGRDLAQRHTDQAAFVRDLPRHRENLPPCSLTTFGLPITIRYTNHD